MKLTILSFPVLGVVVLYLIWNFPRPLRHGLRLLRSDSHILDNTLCHSAESYMGGYSGKRERCSGRVQAA